MAKRDLFDEAEHAAVSQIATAAVAAAESELARQAARTKFPIADLRPAAWLIAFDDAERGKERQPHQVAAAAVRAIRRDALNEIRPHDRRDGGDRVYLGDFVAAAESTIDSAYRNRAPGDPLAEIEAIEAVFAIPLPTLRAATARVSVRRYTPQHERRLHKKARLLAGRGDWRMWIALDGGAP